MDCDAQNKTMKNICNVHPKKTCHPSESLLPPEQGEVSKLILKMLHIVLHRDDSTPFLLHLPLTSSFTASSNCTALPLQVTCAQHFMHPCLFALAPDLRCPCFICLTMNSYALNNILFIFKAQSKHHFLHAAFSDFHTIKMNLCLALPPLQNSLSCCFFIFCDLLILIFKYNWHQYCIIFRCKI